MGDNHKLYKVLDIGRNASEDEIKSAYKKKAMQYHPDKNKGNQECADKFKEISNAYNILGDKDFLEDTSMDSQKIYLDLEEAVPAEEGMDSRKKRVLSKAYLI